MSAGIEIGAREIGRVRGERAGPTLIVVGSMHGNEPSGVLACRRVMAELADRPLPIAGELVMLAGNVAALREGRRYLVKDLNRVWREERVAALAAQEPSRDDAEDREQRELLAAIDDALARARGPAFLVDLHTTSAAGHPFVLFGDTIPQRDFAIALPLPILLGLEEQVDGVLSEHMTRRGLVTLAVEGGQHDDPASIDHLACVVWIALSSAGLLARGDNPLLEASLASLDRARGSVPRVLEVLSRHEIAEGDAFRMEPGFANLAPVSEGRTLATHTRSDRTETVRAPHDGWVMLPLYQGQGSDGFFWGRAVSSRRLGVSRLLRALRLDRALRVLPGVSRDRGDRDRLRVDTRVARFYPLEVFHLFGFRKIREEGTTLVVERRRQT